MLMGHASKYLRNARNLTIALLSSGALLSAADLVRSTLRDNYGKLPMSFEENRGQADRRVKFLSQRQGYSLFLTSSGAVLSLQSQAAPATPAGHAVIRMGFSGARPAALVGEERQAARSSYFLGNDPTKWVTDAPNYARVHYRGLYPGVDVVFYGNQSQLEYDLVVAPGADPKAIRLKYDGVDSMRVDSDGGLVLTAGTGEIRQRPPVIYQLRDGVRQSVKGRYVLRSHHRVAFEIAGYDARKPLVIDPVLSFATYLGTNGVYGLSAAASTTSYPAIAVDSQGNVYVTGFNGGGTAGFPGPPARLTAGAQGGGTEVFVAKMNSTGTTLLYSVVFGGALTDVGGGIAVDSSGNAYVTGFTGSVNFPVSASAPQRTLHGLTNAFVAEVNAAGNALVYSTYLGGNGNDWGRAIAVDRSGNAYVTGTAQEAAGTNFPVTNGSSPASGFLTEINAAGSAFVYSMFVPSPAGIGYGIAVDGSGNAYVTGSTGNALSPAPAQAYVLKVNPGGGIGYGPVIFGSSGATLQTVGFGIALDSQDDAYVTGMTNDPNFPVTAGAAQTHYGGGLTDGFALKLNSAGNLPPVYATYIGGVGSNVLPERGSGIAVDVNGNAYVTGTTQCIDFPSANPIAGAQTSGPAVLMKSSLSGANSTWSPTALAGNFDQVTALAFDASGNLYAGGAAVNPTGGGIHKSSDGGATWSTLGLTTNSIDAIGFDPNNSANIYAIGNGQVFQSTNTGASWTTLAQAVGVSGSLAIASTNPSTVYAGSSAGLIYSTNGGASWKTTTVPVPVVSLSPYGYQLGVVVVVDPNNMNTAYAGSSSSGVFQTTDAGATWVAVNNFPGLTSPPIMTGLAIGNTSTLYAATPNGLYYLSNGGSSWTKADFGSIGSTPALVAVDAVNNVYVAFAGSGIAVGINGGTAASDWSSLSGFPHNPVEALAVQPSVSGTAYVGVVSATDAFLTIISPDGGTFSSSTCFGGSDNNLGQSIVMTPSGAVYVAGLTISQNFPVTSGVVQPSLSGQFYGPFVMGIDSATSFAVTTNSLTFAYTSGNPSPAPQTVGISASPAIAFTAAVSSGGWLSVTPLSGNTPATLTVSVNPANLGAGAYTGTIVINGKITIAVTLSVTSPLPVIDKVVNAASYLGGGISPGEIVAVFGNFLGPTPGQSATINSAGFIGTTLANVQVTFNGYPGPVLYASASQINTIVPYELAGASSAMVKVDFGEGTSTAVTLPVLPSAPGIFSAAASGTGPGAILDRYDHLVTASNPVSPGAVIQIFATGQGQTTPPGVDGLIEPGMLPLPAPILAPKVMIGNLTATTTYVGAAPGLVAGALQVNAVIPDGVASGVVPVVVYIGANGSQAGITVAVQ